MRKIKTAQDVERVRRRNGIIFSLFIVALLLFSYAGFAIMSGDGENENVVNEMGFDFFRENGFWKTSIGGSVFMFQFLPSEVSDVNVNLTIGLGNYSGEVLYFVNPGEGTGEILNNIGNYVLRYQEACLEECEGDLPMKSCDDNLIIFLEGENKVYEEDSCVYLSGDLKATDAFLYKILGIN